MTVSLRSLVIAVAVVAAVVGAYALGADGPGPAAAAPAAPAGTQQSAPTAPPTAPDVRQIAMTGSGSATAVPDQLSFGVGVNTTASDVSTALDSANRITRDVLAALKGQGVGADDVQTSGLNIRATYDYSGEGAPVITGYAVSQDLDVLVRSLPDAGDAISATAAAGGNAIRLSGVRLRVGDEEGLLARARSAAMAEARTKARQYAEASGTALGEVVSVREVGGGGVRTRGLAEAALATDSVSRVPIRAGKADLEVTVAVVWSLA